MADLEWHDFYEIGIDFIDMEHRNMLSIMRRIQEALAGRDLDNVYFITDHLIRASEDHFRHEEEFLEETEYPDLVEHNRYHNELLVQARRIKNICEGMDADHDLNQCFEEMRKFMIDDILYGDIKFKSHLEFKGYIPRKF